MVIAAAAAAKRHDGDKMAVSLSKPLPWTYGAKVILALSIVLWWIILAGATAALADEVEVIGMYRCGYHYQLKSRPFTWYVGFTRQLTAEYRVRDPRWEGMRIEFRGAVDHGRATFAVVGRLPDGREAFHQRMTGPRDPEGLIRATGSMISDAGEPQRSCELEVYGDAS
jgi:hypothetical protein